MMLTVALVVPPLTHAVPPEPLDTAFLDYLASFEGEAGNWTVVADEKVKKKTPAPVVAKPPAPKKPAAEEKKP